MSEYGHEHGILGKVYDWLMICPGGQILLSRRLPGTGQCLSASPATNLSMLRTVITVMSVIASA